MAYSARKSYGKSKKPGWSDPDKVKKVDTDHKKKEEQADKDKATLTNVKPEDKQIFASNINPSANEEAVTHFFNQFGAVHRVFMLRSKMTGKFTGSVFVHFEEANSAAAALKAKPKELKFCERRVYVNNVRPKAQVVVPTNEEREEVIQDAPVFMLNEDIMMYIIDLLPLKDRVKMERVCQSWRQLAMEHWARRTKFNIDEIDIKRKLKDADLEALFKRGCPSMKVIEIGSLRGRTELTNTTLRNIANSCPNLEKLDIQWMDITNRGLMSVVTECPKLEKLSLKCEKITEPGLIHVFDAGKQLKEISITQSRDLEGSCLAKLGQQMTSVLLEDCRSLSDTGLHHLRISCPNLKKLLLIRCPMLTGLGLSIIGEFQFLEKLVLTGSFPLAKPSNIMNVATCKNLKHLTIERNDILDDELVIAISKGCPDLETVEISQRLTTETKVTDKAIFSLAENCPKIRILNLNRCGLISDESLIAFSRLGKLTFLSAKMTQVGNRGVTAIIDGCLELIDIDVFGCNNVTKDVVSEVSEIFKKDKSRKKCSLLVHVGGVPSWEGVASDILQNLPEGLKIELDEFDEDEIERDDYNFVFDSDDSDINDIDDYDTGSDSDYYFNYDDYCHDYYDEDEIDWYGWGDSDYKMDRYLGMMLACSMDSLDS